MCKVKLLTERAIAAERLASENKRSAQQAIKKRNSMDKKLEASKKLVSDLRVAREQYRNYSVVVQERDKALKQVTMLSERVTAAERLLITKKKRLTAAERLLTETKQKIKSMVNFGII